MKKSLIILLVCLFCVPAFAETTEMDLFEYLGRSFEDLCIQFGEVELTKYATAEGVTACPNGDIATCIVYTHQNSTELYGWEAGSIISISLTSQHYSLAGFRVGDSVAEAVARALDEGWTKMEVPRQYCDVGFEKTVDNVKYIMGFSEDHPFENNCLDCVVIDAEYIGEEGLKAAD